jgi:hypothetical protein
VATQLAKRYGLRLYSADTMTWQHRDRALAAGSAAARRWESLSPGDRWEASPAELLEMSLHRERGPMVLADLRALPHSPLVVAEGTTLPPSAVSGGAADRSRAVWLIPTPAFLRAQLAARGTPPGQTRLYLLLAEVIERDAAEHEVPVLPVTPCSSAAATLRAVEARLAPALAAGPLARTPGDQRALLRAMNLAVAAQVRGYYARPWAEGNLDAVVQRFVCECDDPTCGRFIRLPVPAVETAPALAPGHLTSTAPDRQP